MYHRAVHADRVRPVWRGMVIASVLCGVAGGLTFLGTGRADTDQDNAAKHAKEEMIKRGEYLVTIAGCNDCHTPWIMTEHGPEPDMSRMLSGHPKDVKVPPPPKMEGGWMAAGSGTFTAWGGPWGISYAINLTPHETTGLAVWTEEMFIRAMRTGKHMGTSRPIMPPMPWQNLAKATDDDLKAMFAYLRSIPPIDNLVPDYEPPAGHPAGEEGE